MAQTATLTPVSASGTMISATELEKLYVARIYAVFSQHGSDPPEIIRVHVPELLVTESVDRLNRALGHQGTRFWACEEEIAGLRNGCG